MINYMVSSKLQGFNFNVQIKILIQSEQINISEESLMVGGGYVRFFFSGYL